MNQAKNTFKQEAQTALAGGNLKRALENYQNHYLIKPNDLRSGLKLGKVLERLGRKEEAVKVYQGVAEAYAKDGFLLQAISVNKIILRIDPSFAEINNRLAQLYTEKSGETKPLQPVPHIPLFSDLNQQELQSLLSRVHTKTFSKEAYICREGEAGGSLMVISRGEVGISKRKSEGNEAWITDLNEGDFFGEFSFFTDRKRYASVKALTECEILEISRNDLDEIIKVYPRVKEVLNDFFAERVLDLFLALSPLFSSLTHEERSKIIQRFHFLQVPEETIIFQRGDSSTSLYLVKSGEVEISTRNREGQKAVLEMHRRGNCFGVVSLLLHEPCITNAKTTRPSELLELKEKDFAAFIGEFPALQAKVEEISSKRLGRIEEVFSQEAVGRAEGAIVLQKGEKQRYLINMRI